MEHLHHMHHHLAFDSSNLNPLAWAGFAAIFSYSFLSSLHCVGMCGPLACSVLSRQSPHWTFASLLYNGSRILSYTLLGALAGGLAEGLTQDSLSWGRWLALSLGFSIIVSGLCQLFSFPIPALFGTALKVFGKRLSSWILELPPSAQSIGLGLGTVFLPCMTLHPMLFAAAATQSPFEGGMSLLAFALGTLPAMISATYMPSLLPRRANSHFLTKLGPFLLILVGLFTLWRGWV